MIKCSHEKVKDDISCCEHALVVDIGNVACNATVGMCQYQCPCAPIAKELATTTANSGYTKCADEIMKLVTPRLFSVEDDFIAEVRGDIVKIVAAHFA